VRVEGDTVIEFAVDSEVLELLGAALQQGRRGRAVGPNDYLANLPLATLLDLIARTVVPHDVTAQHRISYDYC
jgi:hypothetical protein